MHTQFRFYFKHGGHGHHTENVMFAHFSTISACVIIDYEFFLQQVCSIRNNISNGFGHILIFVEATNTFSAESATCQDFLIRCATRYCEEPIRECVRMQDQVRGRKEYTSSVKLVPPAVFMSFTCYSLVLLRIFDHN